MANLMLYIQANLKPAEIVLILLSWGGTVFLARKNKNKYYFYSLYWAVVIVYITLLRRGFNSRDVVQATGTVSSYVLNVVLYLPLGFFAARSGKWWNCLLYSAVLSGYCELIQYITGCGYGEVQDALCNIGGSAIGGVVSYGYYQLLQSKTQKKTEKKK